MEVCPRIERTGRGGGGGDCDMGDLAGGGDACLPVQITHDDPLDRFGHDHTVSGDRVEGDSAGVRVGCFCQPWDCIRN